MSHTALNRLPTRLTLIATLAATVLVTGCANMDDTQRRTATGAAIGAVAGAVLGKATGNNAGAGAAIGGIAGAVIGNVWSQRMEAQKKAMEQATQGTPVEVTRTADNQLKLEIPADISFDKNSAAIKPELRAVLDTFADGLRKNSTGMVVRIVGHTDSTGSDAINNPLSVNRAQSARDYLVGRGVNSSRISIDGRGSREPVADNGTADGRARNRRIDIFLAERGQR